MTKKVCILLFLFSFALSLQAQQIGLCSHEFYKPMITNPAFTGHYEYTNAMLISRAQWLDFKNAPQLNIFTLEGSVPNKKMGLGFDLYSDKKGLSNKIGGNVFYSYRLKINTETSIRLGVALGVIDHTLNYSQAIVEDPTDLSIQGTTQRKTSINANAGIAFIWKQLEFGISAPQLLGNALEYEDNINGKASYALKRHYLGSLKYQFVISKEKQLSITPLAIIHFIPNTPLQYNANLNLDWKDKLWIGATYKSDYAVAANAGFCINKQLYVGYSYDIIIGTVGKYSGMAHELMLNFVFGKKKTTTGKSEQPDGSTAIQNDHTKADSLAEALEIEKDKARTGEELLRKSNEEVIRLQKENERLHSSANTEKNNEGTKTAVAGNTPPGNENKQIENGTTVITGKNNDYTYLNGKQALKGYYVIISTFFYRDFAQAELKRAKEKGYSSAEIVYSGSKNYNYIAAFYLTDKGEALKRTEKLRADGIKDAWLLSLEE